MTDVANQYAHAVFSLAFETDKQDSIGFELKSFFNGLSVNEWQFFLHPRITKEEKHQVIEKLSLDNLTINFLKVCIDNDRFDLLESIVASYYKLLDESKDIVLVKVTSKIKLTKLNLQKIEKTLKNKLKKSIKIEEIIDKDLSSGIKIEYDGEIIDLTVKRTIDEIKNQLLGGN